MAGHKCCVFFMCIIFGVCCVSVHLHALACVYRHVYIVHLVSYYVVMLCRVVLSCGVICQSVRVSLCVCVRVVGGAPVRVFVRVHA